MAWRIHETEDEVVLALDDGAGPAALPPADSSEMAEFLRLAAAKPAGGVVDFAGRRFLSSTTLAWLSSLSGSAHRHSVKLRVANIAPELRKALLACKLDRSFRLDDGDDDLPGNARAGVPRPHPPGGLGGSVER